jgi:hypothetical protein
MKMLSNQKADFWKLQNNNINNSSNTTPSNPNTNSSLGPIATSSNCFRQASATTGAGYNGNNVVIGGTLQVKSSSMVPSIRPQTGNILNNTSTNSHHSNSNSNSNTNKKILSDAFGNSSNIKVDELSISGDKKSIHNKDSIYESPRRIMRKSFSSSSIEKPSNPSEVCNVQNMDPNLIRNFENIFDDEPNNAILPPPKSPISSNPRSAFANDQRRRMFLKKNSNFDSNSNATGVNGSDCGASLLQAASSASDNELNSKLSQEVASLNLKLAQMNQKSVADGEEIRRLKKETEDLLFYKSNLHVFVEETASFKFLNAVQEQQIRDLETSLSRR